MIRQSYTDLKNTIIDRTKSICNTRLSGKNSIRAPNEYALSVANYYIGVVPMEPNDFESIDNEVRKVLINHKVHL